MRSIWHYKDYSYWFSIEEEKDNVKIFHYAYGAPAGSKMLNYSPYDKMTEEEFRKIVDEMTK
jgi:hypothetical protein